MAVIIDWKNQPILECKNAIIDGLREEIEDIIEINNLKLSPSLTELVEELDIAAYGIGFDLADYIHTREDFLIFMDLVRKGIDKHYHEIPNLPQHTKDLLENFYKELVKISETFSN